MTLKNQETKVLSVVRQLFELSIIQDTVSLNKILHPNYTLTHITGYVQPKSEWFAEVMKESMKYYSATELSHTIHIEDNKANVSIKYIVDARIWGSRNAWRLQQTLQLENQKGKWIILNAVANTF